MAWGYVLLSGSPNKAVVCRINMAAFLREATPYSRQIMSAIFQWCHSLSTALLRHTALLEPSFGEPPLYGVIWMGFCGGVGARYRDLKSNERGPTILL